MATLNLGKLKPVFRGAYNGSTAYVVDNMVVSGDETFICILASTGNATSNATYWTKVIAKGDSGADAGATITTQGDILYRDGSGLQRLAKGTAGQILNMNAGATAPEWVDGSSAGLLQSKGTQTNTNWGSVGHSNDFHVSSVDTVVTPIADNSRFTIWGACSIDDTNSSTFGTSIGFKENSTTRVEASQHECYWNWGADTYHVAIGGYTYNSSLPKDVAVTFKMYLRFNNSNGQYFGGNGSPYYGQRLMIFEWAV